MLTTWGLQRSCCPAKARAASARATRGAEPRTAISRIHGIGSGACAARRLWRRLRREGEAVGRDQAGRLMGTHGLVGATSLRRIRAWGQSRPSSAADLVG